MDLKKSPLFHFSLHAKELFHSNFLAWLGEDPELRPLFKKVIKTMGISEKNIESWGNDFEVVREKYDLDLIIKSSHDDSKKSLQQWYVVIENKVKSVPDKGQLEGYNETIKKHCEDPESVKRILLCLGKYDRELPEGWKEVNYECIIEALRNNIDMVADPYKKYLISDYIDFADSLIKIVNDIEIKEDSEFLYTPDNEIVNLRIDDMIVKWRFSKIADLLTRKYDIETTMGYTNKQPLLHTEIKLENDVVMGIQIQGSQYRRFLAVNKNVKEYELPKVSKGLFKSTREEFRSNIIKSFPGIFVDRSIKGEKNKNFLSYDKNKAEKKTFWYQYVTIMPGVSIAKIAECIHEDINLIKTLKK